MEARLKVERAAISSNEAKKARTALGDELNKAVEEKAAVDVLLKQRDAKLAEARKNELELRQERQQLQEEKETFQLDKQRAIDAERSKIREATQKEADEQSRLKMAEKDKTIGDLQVKLQDALRKAEQGSQQLQGEVLELELEDLLRTSFPSDKIDAVPKGEHGGDVLQRVYNAAGQPCGLILWESKRTKTWSDGWLTKLRTDMRRAEADIAAVVSQVLPKDTETFALVDDVWVTSFACAVPVAVVLRHSLIQISGIRKASDGQQSKAELVYQYLTGSRFRNRVQAIVEKFNEMHEDLEKERRMMTRQWDKRQQQMRIVLDATAGLYGDFQGIAGKTLQEIDGLDIPLLEEGAPTS